MPLIRRKAGLLLCETRLRESFVAYCCSAFYEQSQLTLKQNKEQVDGLRREGKELRNALANMSVHPDFAKPMSELTQDEERERDRAAKIVPGLLAISGVNDEQTTQDCAFILHNLTAVEKCRQNLAYDDIIELVVKLAKTGNLQTNQLCATTLCQSSSKIERAARCW